MRKNLIALIAVAVAAAAFGEGEVNLFRNPDFNEGVTGWSPAGGVVREETMPMSGEWVLRATGNMYHFLSGTPTEWARDTEYTLAIRTRSLGSGSALRIVQMGRNEAGEMQEGTYATVLTPVGPDFHEYYIPFRTKAHLEPTHIAFFKVDSHEPDTGLDIDSIKLFKGRITPFEVRKIGRPGRQLPIPGTEIRPRPSMYGKVAAKLRVFVATDRILNLRPAMNLFEGTGIAYDQICIRGGREDVYSTDAEPADMIRRLKGGEYDVYLMTDKIRAKIGPQLEGLLVTNLVRGAKIYSDELVEKTSNVREGVDDFPYEALAMAEKVESIVRLAKGAAEVPADAKRDQTVRIYAGERHTVTRFLDAKGRTLKFEHVVEPVAGAKLGAFAVDGDRVEVAIDGAAADISLLWSFCDFSGRILAAGKAEGSPARFEVPTSKLYTNLGLVKLSLVKGGEAVDKRTEAVYARTNDLARAYVDYMPSMWPMDSGALDTLAMFRQLEGIGIRASQMPTAGVDMYPLALRSGMVTGSNAIAGEFFWNPGKLKSRKRVPDINSADARRRLREVTAARGREMAKYGPVQTFLQDEGELVRNGTDDEVDNQPENVAAYRQYMEMKYGTIAEYNRRHETSHKSFADLDEALLADAREGGKFAEFVEWRNFNVDRWCEAIRIAGEGVKSTCPDVKFSLVNTFGESAFSGNDYWKLLTKTGCDYSSEYMNIVYFGRGPNTVFDEFYRSFRPDMRVWGYTGYSYTPARARFLPWWTACHRYGGFTWFAATSWGYNLVDLPSYALTTDGYELGKSLEDSKMLTGLGKVLTCWDWAPRDVALYYSHDSQLVSTCLGTEKRCNEIGAEGPLHDFMYSRLGLQFLIEDLLFQHDFVAPEQVVGGKLAKGGYRILFLPRIIAMSDAEIAAVKAFLAAGGKVVADQLPGDYDELGVKRAVNPFAGSAIEVTGRNFDDRDAAQRKALLKTLANAKATRILASPTIATHFGREAMHYVSGGADVYAVIRMPGRGEDADEEEFVFAKPGYVYDTIAGKFLGRTDRVKTKIPNNEGRVFAVLPAKVVGIGISGLPETVAAGADLSLDFGVKTSQTSKLPNFVLHVEFVSPSGEAPRPHMTRNVSTQGGKAHLDFATALNDEKGTWKVRVTEPLTGVTGEKTFEVK